MRKVVSVFIETSVFRWFVVDWSGVHFLLEKVRSVGDSLAVPSEDLSAALL